MAQEIRPCGSGWACCDGNCGNCYKNRKTYSNETEDTDDSN